MKILLRLLLIALCLALINQVYSKNIRVRIFTNMQIDTFKFSVISGKYRIINLRNKSFVEFNNNHIIKIYRSGNRIKTYSNQHLIGIFDSIVIKGSGIISAFKINPNISDNSSRIFNDNLIVKCNDNKLLLINSISLEHYVAGVVEAESSYKNGQQEYYKLQAIICRTYALKNLRKHIIEGFNLCDAEHCQVYKGRCNNSEIIQSVSKTAEYVIVDSQNNLINAAFHANCGGQTVNSEDVWTHPASYLKSVEDTFCIQMTKAIWETSISKKDMLNYLAIYNIKDSSAIDSLMEFRQINRKSYFYDTIRLKQIRERFSLKSTYFSIYTNGDSLIFKGKGNGHGIGLCQEGAMNMVKHGYTVNEIINHYYKNVKIVNSYKNNSEKFSTFEK